MIFDGVFQDYVFREVFVSFLPHSQATNFSVTCAQLHGHFCEPLLQFLVESGLLLEHLFHGPVCTSSHTDLLTLDFSLSALNPL